MATRCATGFVSLVAITLAACVSEPTPRAQPARPRPVASLPAADIRHTVLLIGDAGATRRDDAVLVALRRMAEESPGRTLVVFLGDNVYEAGLPAGDGPDVARLQEVLRAQLWASGSAAALFVAGNHDWADYTDERTAWTDGRAAVARQAAFIARESAGRAQLLPVAGCAGPAALTMGDAPDALRVIAIDSQWWLTALEVPPPATASAAGDTGCTATTTEDAARALQDLVAEQDAPPTIVVAHHPLASNGRHGHPFLGWPFNPQDFPNRRNTRFRTALAGALDSTRVLLYAAGHDHDLELFRGPGARFTLVSGAGSASKVGPFRGRRGAPLARERGPGFARLDMLRDRRVALRLVSVREREAEVRACMWMAPVTLAGQRCE